MKRIILGITGSIAAYKAAEIARALTKAGHRVDVIMTASAARFISPLTLQTLAGHKVHSTLFDEIAVEDVRHISLAKAADLCLVAPATANIIAKLACGIADDFLTTTLLAAHGKPIVVCPAMNTAMLAHPATQRNIQTLKSWGYAIVEPRTGDLACGEVGTGALADTTRIIKTIEEHLC
ncbi:MAG: phosphopantothenoylcysteine decarboxylase [Spirochaetaceae bacterium]|jgi:phosphopantothenoylcysteine decarboxylase/phosphopantothenoylcysteine decarboxylase/phosphopantothenate--cysteine ligase|nr:phosphopantothenoylcysteine decarboxylase [Spirochaetaceae bacterium]